jgi:hypothetical protein
MNAAALKMVPGGREPVRDAEAELDLDTWHAERLGIVRRRSPTKIHFTPVSQLWLRETVKRWARFRLGTGASFGTICSEAQPPGRSRPGTPPPPDPATPARWAGSRGSLPSSIPRWPAAPG